LETLFSTNRGARGRDDKAAESIPGDEVKRNFLDNLPTWQAPGHWMSLMSLLLGARLLSHKQSGNRKNRKTLPGEEVPCVGTVYPSGSARGHVPLVMRRKALGLVGPIPRSRSLELTRPPTFSETKISKSSGVVGWECAWRAMPADLSRERLCDAASTCCQRTWPTGTSEDLPAEIDVFQDRIPRSTHD